MDKLILSEKLRRTVRFTVKTISNVAVTTFALKAFLVYGTAVTRQAQHIVATNGKVWTPSTIVTFKKD